MAVYGNRFYGAFRYGSAATTDISVYPFSAQSLDYCSIKLSWVYPTSSEYTKFLIVRSASGFPVVPDSGDVIYTTTRTTLLTAGTGGTSLLGTTGTLTDTGAFYDPITGAATPTYTSVITTAVNDATSVTLTAANPNIAVGQRVTYISTGNLTGANSGSGIIGGTTVKAINGTSLTLSKPATIPDGTTLTFSANPLTPGKSYYYSAFVLTTADIWQRVGTALGTSIKDYSTTNAMYDSLPYLYKASLVSYGSNNFNKNNDLYNFLRVIGLQYDLIKTKVENAKNRYDVANLDGKLIPALMDQMGLNYESGLGLQQGRRLLTNIDNIYLTKGSNLGFKKFLTAFTGYSSTILSNKNLFLTLDCSSFEYGEGFWNTVSTGTATLLATNTTIEGGSPIPYAETSSPSGFPNSQLGFLKVTATGSTPEFSYGNSPDTLTVSNNAPVGMTSINASNIYTGYVTVTTDTDHGLSIGQYVNLQGFTTNGNGVYKVIGIPNSKSFIYYNSNYASPFGGTVSLAVTNTIPVQSTSTSASIAIQSISGTSFTGVNSSSNIFTVSSTTNVSVGQTITVTSGTGTLSAVTKVTGIVSSTQFAVDNVPTVALSGATIALNGPTNVSITTASQSFAVGQYVKISNVVPAAYNGTWQLQTGTTSTKIVINMNANPGNITTAGTVSATSGSNATITTGTTHSFVPNQPVNISGVVPSGYNGTWIAQPGTTGTSLVLNLPTVLGPITTAGSVKSLATVNVYDPTLYGIPVTGGSSYVFSIASYAKTTYRSIRLGTRWYDKLGNPILPVSSVLISNAVGTWTALNKASSTAFTAPSTAAYAVPYIQITSPSVGEIHYFDAAQFEQASIATTYADSRRVDIYLNANRINQIINPGFESTTNNWIATGTSGFAPETGASNVYPTSSVGLGNSVSTQSAKLTANASSSVLTNAVTLASVSSSSTTFTLGSGDTSALYVGQRLAVTSGTGTLNGTTVITAITNSTQFTVNTAPTVALSGAGVTATGTTVAASTSYYLSAYIKGAATNTATIKIDWYTSAGVACSPVASASSSATTLSTSFTRVSVSAVSPSDAAIGVVTITITGAIGNNYYVDSVLLEASSTLNNYFDGSTGYGVLDDTVWEQNTLLNRGTASNARSDYYPNRILTFTRLNSVLPDYLPLGSNWAIFTAISPT